LAWASNTFGFGVEGAVVEHVHETDGQTDRQTDTLIELVGELLATSPANQRPRLTPARTVTPTLRKHLRTIHAPPMSCILWSELSRPKLSPTLATPNTPALTTL